MKIRIAMVLVFALMSTVLSAQQRKGRGEHRQGGGDRQALEMKEKLALTDEQFTKIKAINEKFEPRFKTLRSDSTLAQDKAQAEMKKINDERQLEIKGVLTEQQNSQWETLKKERKGKRRDVGHRVNNEEMKKALSLNDAQYAKVKEINKKYDDRFKTAHDEMKKLKDEQQSELKSAMTEDQYKKWMALKGDRKGKGRTPGMKR